MHPRGLDGPTPHPEAVTGGGRRRTRRRLVVGGLAASLAATLFPTLSPAPAAAAAAAACAPTDLTCQLEYRIRTNAPGVGERTVKATIGAPALVDAYGDAAPDLAVQLMATPGNAATVRLEVKRLAPGPGQVAVDAIVPIPGRTDEFVSFGYDGQRCGNPVNFAETITLKPITGNTLVDFTAVTETQGAAGCLAVTGGMFREAGGQAVDPLHVSLDQEAVPATSTAAFKAARGGAAEATLAPSTPTVLRPTITKVTGNQTGRLTGKVDQLPVTGITVTWDEAAARATYLSTATVGRIDLTGEKLVGGAVVQTVKAGLTNVPPTTMTVRQAGPKRAELSSTAPIGTFEVGVAEGGAVTSWGGAGDYVRAIDKGAHRTAAARLTGLRSAVLSWDNPLSVQVEKAQAPFTLVADTDHQHLCNPGCGDVFRTTNITVKDLPASVTLTYDKANQVATYTGSAKIGEVRATVTDPRGIGGGADKLDLTLKGVNSPVTVRVPPAGNGFDLDVPHGIDLIEALATSGAAPALPADTNGIYVRDLPLEKVKFLRITGLKKAKAVISPNIELDLDHAGGKFVVDVMHQSPGGSTVAPRDIDVTLDALPAVIDLDVVPATGRIEYHGTAPIGWTSAKITDGKHVIDRPGGLPIRLVEVGLAGLPKDVGLTLTPGSSNIDLTASAPITRADIRMTSGVGVATIPGDKDGLRIHDLSGSYSAHIRVSDLRRATVNSSETCRDLFFFKFCDTSTAVDLLHKDGSNYDVQFVDENKTTHATIDNVAGSVDLDLSGTSLLWAGQWFTLISRTDVTQSRPSGPFFLDTTDRGVRGWTRLSHFPRVLNLCTAEGSAACTGSGRDANGGSMTFGASERVVLNQKQCENATCSSFAEVRDLNLQILRQESHANSTISGRNFIDTDGQNLFGRTWKFENGEHVEDTTLPSGFSAQDRDVEWIFGDEHGSIHCPSGTRILRKVLGFWINVAGLIC